MRAGSGPHTFLSLRWKIFYVVAGIVILMGLLTLVLGTSMDRALRAEHDNKGTGLAGNIATLSAEHVLIDNPLTLASMLEEARDSDREIVYLYVLDRHGDVVADTFHEPFPADLLEIARARPNAPSKSPVFLTEKGPVADFSAPIMEGMAGSLHLGLSEEGVTQRIGQARRRLVLITGFFLLIGLAASHALASFFTRPLADLVATAGELGKGNLDGRSRVASRDEIGALAAAFNRMGDDLRASNEARKAAEESLRRAHDELEERVRERTEQLAAVNQELEAFSYSVSHDLRAPLRSVDGFSLALEEEYEGTLDGKGKDYLHRIRNACGRMGTLIDELLKLSRLSRAEISRGAVDLSAMAASIAEELRESSPGRSVEITIAPGMTAHGDPELLRAMLSNLFRNAWKFTRRASHPKIEFGFLPNGGKPLYYVRDNGVGFDMQYAEKIFGAFQRLHSPGEFEGTGIGLATVRRIVKRHGGTVRAEGEAGKGATFYFTLGMGAA